MKTKTAIALVLACLLWACSPQAEDTTLSRADREYAQGNYVQAENLYQNYLQSSPQGDARWKVWNRLLDICLDINDSPRKAATLLEAMLLEFSDAPERSAQLTRQLADVYMRMRQWDKAAETWQHALAANAGDPDRLWEISFNLGKVYQYQGRYDLSRDAMLQCVQDAPADAPRATCMYELAQAYSLLQNNEQAREWLHKVRAQQAAPEELRARATFLLAEIAVSQGEREKALELFSSIRTTYPNPKVIETRIGLLESK
jgi:tetratricopeptide (TPR) repeat protein